MREHLKRGAVAGLLGGAAMSAVLMGLGEPSIRRAIAIEESRSAGEPSVEVFSRSVQLAGGVTAALLYGILIGTVFGIVFMATRHRLPGSDDFRRSLSLGALGYLALVLVPALKYPPNPPAVGDPDTVGFRTAAYLTLVAASIVMTYAAGRASAWLQRRDTADHIRLSTVGAGFVAAVALAYVGWPGNPDPVTAPATLVWRFRLASLAGTAGLWAVLAVAFGWFSLTAAAKRVDAVRAM